jgi:predicted enzyme related to lactoylglutathione lyase
MVSFIRNVAFDAGDPFALAQFWSGVVGHPVHPECGPGDEEVVIEPPNGPRLFFQAVPESKTVKNRVHVCLRAGDRSRDEELERLLGLGATMVADHREGPGPGPGWVVLGDPEGNEFCVNA